MFQQYGEICESLYLRSGPRRWFQCEALGVGDHEQAALMTVSLGRWPPLCCTDLLCDVAPFVYFYFCCSCFGREESYEKTRGEN